MVPTKLFTFLYAFQDSYFSIPNLHNTDLFTLMSSYLASTQSMLHSCRTWFSHSTAFQSTKKLTHLPSNMQSHRSRTAALPHFIFCYASSYLPKCYYYISRLLASNLFIQLYFDSTFRLPHWSRCQCVNHEVAGSIPRISTILNVV